MVKKTDSAPLAIIVLDRGWVFIGRIEKLPNEVRIEHAGCIRRWGTSKGIGQLALEGPTSNTLVDEAGTVTVPGHAVICLIEAEVSKWPGR